MSVPAPRRRYAINALAAVSMFAAAGCFEKPDDDDDDDDDGGDGGGGAGIVGLWALDSVELYGEVEDYPYTYTDYGYTYSFGVRMDIRTETGGEFYSYYDYVSPSGESERYVDDGYALTISSTGAATYRIEVEAGLVMDCTLGGSSLSCDATLSGETGTLEWQRL